MKPNTKRNPLASIYDVTRNETLVRRLISLVANMAAHRLLDEKGDVRQFKRAKDFKLFLQSEVLCRGTFEKKAVDKDGNAIMEIKVKTTTPASAGGYPWNAHDWSSEVYSRRFTDMLQISSVRNEKLRNEKREFATQFLNKALLEFEPVSSPTKEVPEAVSKFFAKLREKVTMLLDVIKNESYTGQSEVDDALMEVLLEYYSKALEGKWLNTIFVRTYNTVTVRKYLNKIFDPTLRSGDHDYSEEYVVGDELKILKDWFRLNINAMIEKMTVISTQTEFSEESLASLFNPHAPFSVTSLLWLRSVRKSNDRGAQAVHNVITVRLSKAVEGLFKSTNEGQIAVLRSAILSSIENMSKEEIEALSPTGGVEHVVREVLGDNYIMIAEALHIITMNNMEVKKVIEPLFLSSALSWLSHTLSASGRATALKLSLVQVMKGVQDRKGCEISLFNIRGRWIKVRQRSGARLGGITIDCIWLIPNWHKILLSLEVSSLSKIMTKYESVQNCNNPSDSPSGKAHSQVSGRGSEGARDWKFKGKVSPHDKGGERGTGSRGSSQSGGVQSSRAALFYKRGV
jgi:hypothetical protein